MNQTKLKKIVLLEDKQDQGRALSPVYMDIDQFPTLIADTPIYWDIDQLSTLKVPVPQVKTERESKGSQEDVLSSETFLAPLRKLIKTSGIYALSAVAPPLVSLVLAPLLTHHLSPSDYGVLTILNLFISLSAGISQLGLPSAFFRAYGYDYTTKSDQRDVLATVSMLLFLVSLTMTVGVTLLSSLIAQLLLGRSLLGSLIVMAGGIILLQNLTVPGFSWLRAENRAFSYSLLSISNLLITLIGTIVLVVVFHLGIAGSLIANGCGYAALALYIVPTTLRHARIKLRIDIARNLLAFGLPLVLNFVSFWILQLSDRYLLSRFDSLAQTAMYAVAYTMGSVINVLIMGPFTLAWPTAMFSIAKREDAPQVFRLVFRWFSFFLLFAAFGLSLLGIVLLNWLFPVAYHASGSIIPIVAASIVFYGVYYVFMVGSNITRKTWLAAVFTTIAAIVNIMLNLILIPLYGPLGAALSTLLAYIVLALAAYLVNQRIYFIPFEMRMFGLALLLGIVIYVGSTFVRQRVETPFSWCISLFALCLYGGCLALLVKLPTQGDGSKKKLGKHL